MTKLFIGQLPFSTNSNDLKLLFEKIGKVDDAFVVLDRETKRSKGFGFISTDDDTAKLMISQMDGYDLEGRSLTVNVAQDKSDKPKNSSFGGQNRSNLRRDSGRNLQRVETGRKY